MIEGKNTPIMIERDISVLPAGIFDGQEPHNYEDIIPISNHPWLQLSLADVVRNPFRKLPELIGQDGFDEIVGAMNLRIPVGPFQTWMGLDEMPLYFHLMKNNAADGHLLILLSWGEFQPGRYVGNLEAIWRVTNLE